MNDLEYYKAECPFCGQHIEVPFGFPDWIRRPNETCAKTFPPNAKLISTISAAFPAILPAIPQSDLQETSSRLTICPDCSRQVSRRAEVCPGCGAPLKFISAQPTKFYSTQKKQHCDQIYKTEALKEIETARKGRGLVVCGSLMMIASVGGCATGTHFGVGTGLILFLGGLGIFVAGRLFQN